MDLDALLQRFYSAEDRRAESALELLVRCMAPRMRAALVAKGVRGDDLDDLLSEATLRLIEGLRRSKQAQDGRVRDCGALARALAERTCIDYFRAGSPWRKLQLSITYLLDGRGGARAFARWKIGGDWLGGFAAWRGRKFEATPRFRQLSEDRSAFQEQALEHRPPADVPLPELVARLFRWLGTPLPVRDLVTHVASLLDARRVTVVSLEEIAADANHDTRGRSLTAPTDVAGDTIGRLSAEETRVKLWHQIRALRPNQRSALLLAMEWEDLLLLAGTISAVAAALNTSLEEFLPMARRLPLADQSIAECLGATRLQVSNLRKCARERLARWMARTDEGGSQ